MEENEPWTSSPIGIPKLLHSFDDQRASSLTFEPGTHRVFGADGNTVTVYTETPTLLWEDVQFRKHLGIARDGRVLLDQRARKDADSSTVTPPLGPGYEIREACRTLDGEFVAFHIGWRPPRGRPVEGRDGSRSYKYARPNEPDGPETYFEVLRADTNERVLRVDEVHSNFACSERHVAVGMARSDTGVRHLLVDPANKTSTVLDRGSDTPAQPGFPVFSPDGRVLAIATIHDEISTWVPPNFQLLKRGKIDSVHISTIALHPGGTLFLGLKDGRMMLVHPATLEVLHTWIVPEHKDLAPFQRSIADAAFSDDGQRLATSHSAVGTSVRIWEFEP